MVFYHRLVSYQQTSVQSDLVGMNGPVVVPSAPARSRLAAMLLRLGSPAS